jgi:hypothetical protein
MSQEEVENLLGKSVSETYCLDQKVKCISYGLGTCYSNALGSRNEDLTICFDQERKVIQYGLKEVDNKLCNHKMGHCMRHKEKCKCYTQKNQTMGQECQFEIERW